MVKLLHKQKERTDMKVFKFLLILTIAVLVGGIIALVISKKSPKIIVEKLQQMMMNMCEKMKSMDCCKSMMEKHCK
jgi:hypothetical protein